MWRRSAALRPLRTGKHADCREKSTTKPRFHAQRVAKNNNNKTPKKLSRDASCRTDQAREDDVSKIYQFVLRYTKGSVYRTLIPGVGAEVRGEGQSLYHCHLRSNFEKSRNNLRFTSPSSTLFSHVLKRSIDKRTRSNRRAVGIKRKIW